jgi:hypothetical protein
MSGPQAGPWEMAFEERLHAMGAVPLADFLSRPRAGFAQGADSQAYSTLKAVEFLPGSSRQTATTNERLTAVTTGKTVPADGQVQKRPREEQHKRSVASRPTEAATATKDGNKARKRKKCHHHKNSGAEGATT